MSESALHDYSEFEDQALKIGDNVLGSISSIAKDYLEAERAVEHFTAELEAAKKRFRVLRERTLPKALEDAGNLEDITIDGLRIERDIKLRGSIPKDKAEEAFSWLEEHGHGKIIKRQFQIEFGKDEDTWADKFERDCAQRKKPLALSRKKAVHPGTLLAFLRTELEKGDDIPLETFGVYRQNFAKVTAK
jgi:hypothetical protein